MAKKEGDEVFVSINPYSYRESKSSGLLGQVELLHSLKHIQNLKTLAEERNNLKVELQKLLALTISELNTLQSKMPNPKVPKQLQLVKVKESLDLEEVKEEPQERDAIEEELLMIRAKLKQLNSQ